MHGEYCSRLQQLQLQLQIHWLLPPWATATTFKRATLASGCRQRSRTESGRRKAGRDGAAMVTRASLRMPFVPINSNGNALKELLLAPMLLLLQLRSNRYGY